MAEQSQPDEPQLFDIGAVLMQTYRLYGGCFFAGIGLVGLPYALISLALALVIGLDPVAAPPTLVPGQAPQPQPPANVALIGGGASLALLVLMPLFQAVILRMAMASHLGQGVQLSASVKRALMAALPLYCLGALIALVSGLGLVIFLVPGLYVLAMFYMVAPAIVLERRGFGALGRSLELTCGFRWPIIGLIVVLAVIAIAAQFVSALMAVGFTVAFSLVASLAGGAEIAPQTTVLYQLLVIVIDVVRTAIVVPLLMVGVAATYLRLVHIKHKTTDEPLKNLID